MTREIILFLISSIIPRTMFVSLSMAMSSLGTPSEPPVMTSMPSAIALIPDTIEWKPTEIHEAMEAKSKGWRDALIEAAESQVGVRYQSLHYGPKGDPFGNGEGFGCAMFVAYAYNTVFFDGHRGDDNSHQTDDNQWFCGYTAAFWAAVTGEPNNDTNWGLVEVEPENAQPGDVICYVSGNNPYSSRLNCGHASMYYGDGKEITAGGISDIDIHASGLHFLSFAESNRVLEYERLRAMD